MPLANPAATHYPQMANRLGRKSTRAISLYDALSNRVGFGGACMSAQRLLHGSS